MDKHNKHSKSKLKATGKGSEAKAVPVAVVEPVITKVDAVPGVKGKSSKK